MLPEKPLLLQIVFQAFHAKAERRRNAPLVRPDISIIAIIVDMIIATGIIVVVNDSLTEPEVSCQVLTIDTRLFTAFHLQQRSIIL